MLYKKSLAQEERARAAPLREAPLRAVPLREISIVLASRSPQRLALLARLNIAPRLVLPVDINEAALKKENARALVTRLALAKARAAQKEISQAKTSQAKISQAQISQEKISHVLAADTTVLCARHILEKPRDAQQASEFLKMLSGRRHQVWSAVVLANASLPKESSASRNSKEAGEEDNKEAGEEVAEEAAEKPRIRVVMTRVAFKRLTQREIEEYLATDEWQGSAGAYRIQGYAEAFVRSINGSYSAVVGLPLFETRQLLVSQNLL